MAVTVYRPVEGEQPHAGRRDICLVRLEAQVFQSSKIGGPDSLESTEMWDLCGTSPLRSRWLPILRHVHQSTLSGSIPDICDLSSDWLAFSCLPTVVRGVELDVSGVRKEKGPEGKQMERGRGRERERERERDGN